MKIYKLINIHVGLILIILGMSACSLPAAGTPETDPTELALIVNRTQTAIAVVEAATEVVMQTPILPTETEAVLTSPTSTASPEPTSTSTSTITITPTPQPEDCTNKAKFIEETIPDKTSMGANKKFTKTWTLQNIGTCTWTPEYMLVFVDGEQMGGLDPTKIGKSVAPQSQETLLLDFTAPSTSGVYQGNWKLKSPGGTVFGLGKNADKPFWVNITVVESSSELDLGDPTWTDSFDSDSGFWQLGKDSFLEYKLSGGQMIMTSLQKSGDQWRMNSKPAVKNLFLEANFKTGDTCSGKDSYGIIVRSSDTGDDVFDSGYVFTFSCDGMYRLYRMDNGTYIGLLNWTASQDIKSGPDQLNRMGILVEGNLIKLYANGNRLAQVSDEGHQQGKWGLSIRSVDTTDFTVFVEDIAYWIMPE